MSGMEHFTKVPKHSLFSLETYSTIFMHIVLQSFLGEVIKRLFIMMQYKVIIWITKLMKIPVF